MPPRKTLFRIIAITIISKTFVGYPLLAEISRDDASRYTLGSQEGGRASNWTNNGHRGDLGFGVWNFEVSPHSGSAGRFIGDSTAGAGNVNTVNKAFALFAYPNISPAPHSAAIRRFNKPALTTGDSISFEIAINFRNGNKGFGIRDCEPNDPDNRKNRTPVEKWNFNVSKGGYFIRNGPPHTPRDDGQRLGAYHSNTIFTFTFTQKERTVDWTIQRSGGITSSYTGSFPADSGTLADFYFYVSGTDGPNQEPQNALYFNNFVLTPGRLGDSPLTPGERRMPGYTKSYFLRYQDPSANTVTVRHSGDGFASSHPMSNSNEIWELDIRSLNLKPGWHSFKFQPNSAWEAGDNRQLYLDKEGRIALPPAVYLSWQKDPTTTMMVHWYSTDPNSSRINFRAEGQSGWEEASSEVRPFPHTERYIHNAELEGLLPDQQYEFQVPGHTETLKFRTMPASLTSRPVKIGIGGDVSTGSTADQMTAAISSKDPDFLVIGGDHAYADARAANYWKWYRYMESFFHHARSPDGRLLPLVVGIGNHEVYNGFSFNHPDFDDSQAWRDRYASYFSRTFRLPDSDSPYGVLDFKNYLSLIILDTEHSSPLITGHDRQSVWLEETLGSRKTVKHLLPIYHVPAYPSNRTFDDPTSKRIRQHWVPLFEKSGIKLAFEHHDHTYKRTKPLLRGAENDQGIIYLGDGLWGIEQRTPDTSRWYLNNTNVKHHVHLITLTETERTAEAINLTGEAFGGRLNQSVDSN